MVMYIISGLIGVSNMILWGWYGDLLVEKFCILKVVRSITFGLIWSIALFIICPNLSLFVFALVVIALERFTTEIYKIFFREENQSKYIIPSNLNIKINRVTKRLIGIFVFILLFMFLYYINLNYNKICLAIFSGLFIALGGMIKDAPYEGFDKIKFFRSPLVAIFVGLCLYELFPNLDGKFFLLSIAGGERILSEFYKKIYKGRVPGKFKKIEINNSWRIKRKKILYLYFLNISGLIGLLFAQ